MKIEAGKIYKTNHGFTIKIISEVRMDGEDGFVGVMWGEDAPRQSFTFNALGKKVEYLGPSPFDLSEEV